MRLSKLMPRGGVLSGLGSGVGRAGDGLSGSLSYKAIDAAVGVITRIVSGLFPARTPRAIFDFEVKDQVKTLVVVKKTGLTEDGSGSSRPCPRRA